MRHAIATPTFFRLFCISVGILLAGCAQPPERDPPVGRSFEIFEDTERPAWGRPGNRPLGTTVWYPAAAGSVETEWRIGVFRAGWTAFGAPLVDTPRQLPLVVLSHGTGGAALQLSWLAEQLAADGYLVAAVNHHGNTGAEEAYQPQGFMLWWERARDVSVVIDKLLEHPELGPRIDPSRIGVAGFSLGGYTTLTVAGARTHRAQWQRFCADQPEDSTCVLPPESPFSAEDMERLVAEDESTQASIARSQASYRDARVRAAYAIAPVLGPAMDVQSLAEISIPVRIVVGERDDQALPEVTARPVQRAIPGAELELLPGVGHYTFLSTCSWKGRFVLAPLCKDSEGVDRSEVHRRVGADAVAFFRESLASPGATVP